MKVHARISSLAIPGKVRRTQVLCLNHTQCMHQYSCDELQYIVLSRIRNGGIHARRSQCTFGCSVVLTMTFKKVELASCFETTSCNNEYRALNVLLRTASVNLPAILLLWFTLNYVNALKHINMNADMKKYFTQSCIVCSSLISARQDRTLL